MVKKLKYFIVLITTILLVTSFALYKKGKAGTIKTIVIDPGHGGKDPGCNGVTFKEKDVSLAVALKLGKLIEENYKDVKVIYTRTTDVFVELEDRAQIANKAKADLFISIHCNAAGKPVYVKDPKTGKKRKKTFKNKKGKLVVVEKPNPEPFGTETYVMGLKNEEGKMKVATRENSAIFLEDDYEKKYEGFDPDSPESYIIMSNYTSAYVIQSANLAVKIQDEYTKKAGRIDKGVHRQSIWVLWRTAMPSILTEIGYLTNPLEEQFLGSKEGQDYLAKAIFRGFRKYKDDIEGTKKEYNDDLENQTPLENENVKAGNIPGHRTKDPDEEEDEDEVKKDEKSQDAIQKRDTIKTIEFKEIKTIDGSKKIDEVKKDDKQQDVITKKDSIVIKKQETTKHETEEDSVSAKKIAEKFKNDNKTKETGHKTLEEKKDEIKETKGKEETKKKDGTKTVTLSGVEASKEKKNQIVFKVQFASSEVELNLKQDKFKKIVDGNYYKVKSVLKYTSGNFENIKDAINHQNMLRENGFKDCFVIALKNGERMDVNEAKKLMGQ
jgi:N-acetylmuramoyl-L-alanine amidase